MKNIHTSTPITVTFQPIKTFKFLLYFIVGLTLANVLVRVIDGLFEDIPEIFIRLFNTDKEQNIPTLFSGFLLLFCSIMLYNIYKFNKNTRYSKHWKGLSIIFLLMSIDETLSFHETLQYFIKNILNINTSGFLYFAWVIPGAAFVLVFIVCYLGFIKNLPPRFKRLFLIAGSLYVTGSLFLELFAGYIVDPTTTHDFEFYFYLIQSTSEECLEMLGIAIFAYALMSYITSYIKETNWTFRIASDDNTIISHKKDI